MMNMEKRAERLNQELERKGADFRVIYKKTWKNNRVYEGYVLKADNSNCCPLVYQQEWYDLPDAAAADCLIRIFQEKACTIATNSIVNPDYVRDHILPRVVSAANIPALEKQGILYDTYLDLAVLYYLPIDFYGGDGASVQVTNRILAAAGLTKVEAAACAKHNLASEVEVIRLSDLLSEIAGGYEESILSPDTEPGGKMLVLTNTNRYNGAAVILLGDTLFVQLEKQLHSKLAFLASSIHELIAVPYRDREDLSDYQSMVYTVNREAVAREDQLCDNVYYLDNGHVRPLA